jgi:hypothetical protein
VNNSFCITGELAHDDGHMGKTCRGKLLRTLKFFNNIASKTVCDFDRNEISPNFNPRGSVRAVWSTKSTV